MSGHVHPKRLFEIAQKDIVLDEDEWPHLRECDFCMDRFTDFIRQIYRDKKAKSSDSESVAGSGTRADAG